MSEAVTVDEEKRLQDTLTVDWDVYTMATFDAVIADPELFAGFDDISIERDDVEVFNGRVEQQQVYFSAEGRYMVVTGFDHTVRLRDYKTPIQSIAGTTTASVLGSILVETPFTTSTSGTFEYITPLQDWDTWVEMVTDIELFSDVTVELDLDTTEIEHEIDGARWTGCGPGLKSCFYYDGDTPRFYVFAKDAGNNIQFWFSEDGETWTGPTWFGINATSDQWSVAWNGTDGYFLYYDGINTDCVRFSINDVTGAITGVVVGPNVFTGPIRFGPIFDSQGDIWVIRSTNNGEAYESVNNGANFNYRFGPGANELWGLADKNNDGDVTGFEFDSVNNDIEEWLWDRSAGSYTFQNKIDNEDDVDGMDVCQDGAYNVYVAWWDTDDDDIVLASNQSGSWSDTTIDVSPVALKFSIGSDGKHVYLIWVGATGTNVEKYYNVTQQQSWNSASYGTPLYCSTPRGYLQDGNIAIFFTLVDSNDDLWFIAFSQIGLRLVEAATSGYVRSATVTASGAFTSWGVCTAGGSYIDETTWNILRAATNVELIDNQLPNFDMNLAGVPSTDTSIKVYIVFDGSTYDPIIYEFSVTERTDQVSLSTDGEDCYTAVQKLAALAGAEFWVVKNDDGSYTVYFSTRRGEDKSDYIILKCSTTTDELDTKANIKVLYKVFDYTNYANAVLFIGGLDSDGNRVEVEIRDSEQITERGQEYWYTLRDAEVTTTSMGRTLAVLELNQRNAPVTRIRGEFLDKNASNAISIGDSVSLIGEWRDGDLKIEGGHRIVTLSRIWGVGGGERVVAEFTNRTKPVQYYNYVKKINDLERVVTS